MINALDRIKQLGLDLTKPIIHTGDKVKITDKDCWAFDLIGTIEGRLCTPYNNDNENWFVVSFNPDNKPDKDDWHVMNVPESKLEFVSAYKPPNPLLLSGWGNIKCGTIIKYVGSDISYLNKIGKIIEILQKGKNYKIKWNDKNLKSSIHSEKELIFCQKATFTIGSLTHCWDDFNTSKEEIIETISKLNKDYYDFWI
jgi:hypothetical protein